MGCERVGRREGMGVVAHAAPAHTIITTHPNAPHRARPPAAAGVGQGGAGPRERLTYAIKDTVSVLYWYEKLSRNGKFFEKIFESFFLCFSSAQRRCATARTLEGRSRRSPPQERAPTSFAIYAPFFE